VHESLEKIKEYCAYYDWYDHVSIYDMRYLIHTIEQQQKEIEKLRSTRYSEMSDIAKETFGFGE
jgi:hypothetical protein